jgi:hypothetical protein
MTAAEIAYLEELPPETQPREWRAPGVYTQPFVETRGRHHCPTHGCGLSVRYGNVVCAMCWQRIPEDKRREVARALRLRQARPDLWAIACNVVLQLANDYVAPNCRTRTPSSRTDRSPESDPATRRST